MDRFLNKSFLACFRFGFPLMILPFAVIGSALVELIEHLALIAGVLASDQHDSECTDIILTTKSLYSPSRYCRHSEFGERLYRRPPPDLGGGR